jgi:hypothetical protein
VSISLGRSPVLLRGPTVPFFSAVDDEYIETTKDFCVQPQSTFSRVSFAVSMCRLGQILGDIQDNLYLFCNTGLSGIPMSTGSGNNQGVSLDEILALETSLQVFEKELPVQLSSRDTDEHDVAEPYLRQRLSLRVKLVSRLNLFLRC